MHLKTVLQNPLQFFLINKYARKQLTALYHTNLTLTPTLLTIFNSKEHYENKTLDAFYVIFIHIKRILKYMITVRIPKL